MCVRAPVGPVNFATQKIWIGRGLVWEQKLPLWLPAGSTLAVGQNVNSISVIEFTVVP